MSIHTTADAAVEKQLRTLACGLEKKLDADVLAYVGLITDGVDNGFRGAIEARNNKNKKLAIILGTQGGYIEVAERIVTVTRRHYNEVDF